VAKDLVEKNGGEFKTSVSKGLTYLVQADPSSNSTKTQKARKYGTEVIGPDDFLDMVNFDEEL
jgi:DNA ligase (NAD+)